jgi:hypothetical protein
VREGPVLLRGRSTQDGRWPRTLRLYSTRDQPRRPPPLLAPLRALPARGTGASVGGRRAVSRSRPRSVRRRHARRGDGRHHHADRCTPAQPVAPAGVAGSAQPSASPAARRWIEASAAAPCDADTVACSIPAPHPPDLFRSPISTLGASDTGPPNRNRGGLCGCRSARLS